MLLTSAAERLIPRSPPSSTQPPPPPPSPPQRAFVRQLFWREVRTGLYLLPFPYSCDGALEMLGEGIRPELIVILSDINMPGMDGLTLLREIKQRWPDLPVMMVTAYGDEQ